MSLAGVLTWLWSCPLQRGWGAQGAPRPRVASGVLDGARLGSFSAAPFPVPPEGWLLCCVVASENCRSPCPLK